MEKCIEYSENYSKTMEELMNKVGVPRNESEFVVAASDPSKKCSLNLFEVSRGENKGKEMTPTDELDVESCLKFRNLSTRNMLRKTYGNPEIVESISLKPPKEECYKLYPSMVLNEEGNGNEGERQKGREEEVEV